MAADPVKLDWGQAREEEFWDMSPNRRKYHIRNVNESRPTGPRSSSKLAVEAVMAAGWVPDEGHSAEPGVGEPLPPDAAHLGSELQSLQDRLSQIAIRHEFVRQRDRRVHVLKRIIDGSIGSVVVGERSTGDGSTGDGSTGDGSTRDGAASTPSPSPSHTTLLKTIT